MRRVILSFPTYDRDALLRLGVGAVDAFFIVWFVVVAIVVSFDVLATFDDAYDKFMSSYSGRGQ
jgi:hypothetical protein